MASWELLEYIKTKLQTTCFHFILTIINHIKKSHELVSLPHFLHNFWRKIFLLLYSINWPNFIVWLPLLCEILGNMCIAIVCKLVELFKNLINDTKVITKIMFARSCVAYQALLLASRASSYWTLPFLWYIWKKMWNIKSLGLVVISMMVVRYLNAH